MDGAWVNVGWVGGCNTSESESGGWIHNADLRLGTRGYTDGCGAYERPSYWAPVFSEFRGGSEGKVIGCSGAWLLHEHWETEDSEFCSGWLEPEDQCPNSVTNC
jgi:hypothetical protein